MDIIEIDGETFCIAPSDDLPGWYEVLDEYDQTMAYGKTMEGAVHHTRLALQRLRQVVETEVAGILG